MRFHAALARLVISSIVIASCLAPTLAQDGAFPGRIGLPYRGTVTVEAVSPQGGAPVHQGIGQAEVTMAGEGQDRIRIEGHATLDGQQVLRFGHLVTEMPAMAGSRIPAVPI